MPKASPSLTTFDAGELSPLMGGRTDLAKYFNGCAKLRNFIPLVQGPLQRRGGTRFVAATKYPDRKNWLMKFQVSETQAYMLEFGHGYIRVYANRGQLVSGGVPVEISTPYLVDDLTASDGTCRIRVIQSADTMYIFHRNHRPRKLLRVSATEFQLVDTEFTSGPFQDVNANRGLTVTASGETGDIVLNASGPVFNGLDAGSLFRLESADYSSVKPWAVYQEIGVGELRRVDFRVYICTATGGHSSEGGPVTGTLTPTHTEGKAWDGDGSDTDGDQRGSIGVEWEFLHSSFGIARITNVVGASTANATVIDRLPSDLVPGGGSSTTVTDFTIASISNVQVGFDVRLTVSAPGHPFVVGDPVVLSGTNFKDTNMLDLDLSRDGSYVVLERSSNTYVIAGSIPDNYAYDPLAAGNARRTIRVDHPQNAPSWKWSIPIFSDSLGWPEHGAFWRERLVLARDRRIAMSVPGDFENFSSKIGGETTPDSAIVQTLNARKINRIVWIVESDSLILGTNGDEWVIGPIQPNEAVGPGNIRAEPRTANGSRSIQPLQVGGRILFVQTSGRKVRDYEYDYASDNYQSADTTKLAAHITKSGLVDLTFQQEPDSIVWAARADGCLVGMTYDREAERSDVYGWHPHPFQNGAVESVESMPSPDGSSEDLWLIVRRQINGQTVRYVEYLNAPLADDESQAEAFYVDCGLTYRGAPASVVSGLSHLEGQTVDVLTDGAAHPQVVVAGGAVALQEPASIVHVGIPAPCELVTMNIEAGAADGTAQGKTKRITNIVIRMFRSSGGEVGPSTGELQDLEYRTPQDQMDMAVPLYSGDSDPITWQGGYETAGQIRYLNDQPFPVILLAILPNLQTQDDR